MKRTIGAALMLALPAAAAAQSCRVDVTALAFGVYDPAQAAPALARGEIALVCGGDALARPVTRAAIRLGGDAVRELAGAGRALRYTLFQDAAAVRPWRAPDTLVVALPDAQTGRVGETRVPVYGRIAPGQWVPPGTYQDVVEVIVEF
ncbi:spore coat U domain-containing protein [Tahibacter soli]|jgi:spore coat protein U-like protein|uniref:Spore coat U domain-containing protein n=1 Tax=Tahibacter soli TaxID=2983605 RepID=A0A9X3YK87_9GAMM|nr:spore coat U domain-containing protein [Tahibacter soli]MDC8013941.1 spore coat U domain-containing protein [Tahibacter soli]